MKTKILNAAFFTPMAGGVWGLPLILWGDPGAAKTATIKALAKRYGLHLEHLAPGERGEGAFGVTPVPDDNGSRTVLRYPPPEWIESLLVQLPMTSKAAKIDEGQKGPLVEEQGIVFLDELNTAPPALQPALLGAIQERRIGGHTFGPRVRVLGAANPVSQAAGGWDIAPPVANRLGHIDWPAPEAEEWGDWLIGGSAEEAQQDARAEEARVVKAWPEAWAKAAGLVSAFVRRRPELLHKMPKDGDPAQSRAWPSPRTWEYAVRSRASAEVHGLSAVDSDELVSAFIGNGAAGELATWIQEQDLPSPTDLLDGKAEFKHDPKRLDRTEAVLSSCAALVVPAKADKRHERVAVLWDLMAAVMEDAKDVVVPGMTALVQAGLQKGEKARPVLAKMHSVVTAAGVNKGGRR